MDYSKLSVPPDFKRVPEGLAHQTYVELFNKDGLVSADVVPLFVGPDGGVYAQVCTDVTQLPKDAPVVSGTEFDGPAVLPGR